MTAFGCHPLHLWLSHYFDKTVPFVKVQKDTAPKAKVHLPSPIHANLCPSRGTLNLYLYGFKLGKLIMQNLDTLVSNLYIPKRMPKLCF